MLGIILGILKIIGIIILVILAILIVVLCLVLFVPLRYSAVVNKNANEDEIFAALKATWLLHILSLTLEYREGELKKILKIFGVVYRKRGKKDKGSGRFLHRKEKKPDYVIESYNSETDDFATKEVVRGDEKSPVNTEPASLKDKVKDDDAIGASTDFDASDEEKGFFSKVNRFVKAIIDFFRSFSEKTEKIKSKINDLINNISYYSRAFEDKYNKEAFEIIIKEAKRVLKYIKPTRLKGKCDIGLEDPADTGNLLIAMAVLYPLYGDNIIINPDFNNEIMAVDLKLKGRIRLIVLIVVTFKLYFNKKIKRMIRIMKKENKKNGRK